MAPLLLRAIALFYFATGVIAVCSTIGKRRAWYVLPPPPLSQDFSSSPKSQDRWLTYRCPRHTFSNVEKLEYINAELCLMQKPAKLGLSGCKTRFDELQAVHQLQSYATHHVVCWYTCTAAWLLTYEGRLPPLPPSPYESPRRSLEDRMQLHRLPTVRASTLLLSLTHSFAQLLARATRCRKIHLLHYLLSNNRLRWRRLGSRKLHHHRPVR